MGDPDSLPPGALLLSPGVFGEKVYSFFFLRFDNMFHFLFKVLRLGFMTMSRRFFPLLLPTLRLACCSSFPSGERIFLFFSLGDVLRRLEPFVRSMKGLALPSVLPLAVVSFSCSATRFPIFLLS